MRSFGLLFNDGADMSDADASEEAAAKRRKQEQELEKMLNAEVERRRQHG